MSSLHEGHPRAPASPGLLLSLEVTDSTAPASAHEWCEIEDAVVDPVWCACRLELLEIARSEAATAVGPPAPCGPDPELDSLLIRHGPRALERELVLSVLHDGAALTRLHEAVWTRADRGATWGDALGRFTARVRLEATLAERRRRLFSFLDPLASTLGDLTERVRSIIEDTYVLALPSAAVYGTGLDELAAPAGEMRLPVLFARAEAPPEAQPLTLRIARADGASHADLGELKLGARPVALDGLGGVRFDFDTEYVCSVVGAGDSADAEFDFRVTTPLKDQSLDSAERLLLALVDGQDKEGDRERLRGAILEANELFTDAAHAYRRAYAITPDRHLAARAARCFQTVGLEGHAERWAALAEGK